MSEFRLLIAEDSEEDLAACRDSIARYEDEKKRSVELVECKTVDDALQKLDSSFDGAIIDLKLADEGDEGNQISRRIFESHFRIPVVIFTGTPDSADFDLGLKYLEVFKKGEKTYAEILDSFFGIYDTGMTRIMGGRGIIEKTLNEVFLKNLLPQRTAWVEYGKLDAPRTERALLRFTLNHLLQLLDEDTDQCFPEEVYIYPPLNDKLNTGSIIKDRQGEDLYVVLNPPCDLVVRDSGKFNTDRILLVEIDKEEKVYGYILKKLKTDDEKAEKLYAILHNRHDLYHHWLPRTSFFPGGFINFRKLATCSKKECTKQYEKPHIQISPHFVKDILARFSSYYARQGQPDIECARIIESIIASRSSEGSE
jgi:hypothetical protein